MYNIGIIGFGGMANWHAKYIDKYSKTKVRGIFDINPERNNYAKSKGYTTYTGVEAMLADPLIDAVIIATTNEVHKELSIQAMAAGKHVICEKPVTLNSAELQEIIDASKKYNRVFTINQNRRTNKDFELMRQKVEEGLIGDIYIIESRVQGSRGIPKGWRTLKALGGGMMLDWGVHLIDQIMYMIDEKVINVYCKMYNIEYSEVDDNFHLTIVFENKLTAIVEVSTNSYITLPRWYVSGKEGTLKIDDWNCNGKIVRNIDKENVWNEEIIRTEAGPSKTMAPRSKNSVEEIILVKPEGDIDDLIIVYEQFILAIEGLAELTITAEQALRVMKVIDAAFLSHKSGNMIKVEI